MFDSLTTRFQDVFESLRGEVRLTPEAVESALGEIRIALLEADVNFKVVKAFVERVRDRAIDRSVLDSLTPAQQVVAIVRDEMLVLLGDGAGGLSQTTQRPQVVLILGLQGSGKTTTSAKLGQWLVRQGRHPLLVSTDVRRPAAIRQLSVLCEQAGLRTHDPAEDLDPTHRASTAVEEAKQLGFDTVIVDTAGRLHVDDELMFELEAIKTAVRPSDILYVADAMTGQDAIKSAGEFHRRAQITGLVLSKMDGDARGGAALSVVSVVGVPIVFGGMGERLDDLELFQPERLVSRMLGMGDVLTLVERAEQAVDRDDAERLTEKLRRESFTLEDLRSQMDTIRKMGPLDQLASMIPGLGRQKALGNAEDVDPKQLARTAAIIDSMTVFERRDSAVINGSRRKRIASGSGTDVQDVNRLLKQFGQMRKMLKAAKGVAGKRKGKGKGKGKVRQRSGRLGLAGSRHGYALR
jgi:signal recognition particle subunit SRP54